MEKNKKRESSKQRQQCDSVVESLARDFSLSFQQHKK